MNFVFIVELPFKVPIIASVTIQGHGRFLPIQYFVKYMAVQ
jgi:hypothetical protein